MIYTRESIEKLKANNVTFTSKSIRATIEKRNNYRDLLMKQLNTIKGKIESTDQEIEVLSEELKSSKL